jgi:hypothetical protein
MKCMGTICPYLQFGLQNYCFFYHFLNIIRCLARYFAIFNKPPT